MSLTWMHGVFSVLHVNPPPGDLIDIRSIDRLLYSGHPMQSGLREGAFHVAVVIFKFGERLYGAPGSDLVITYYGGRVDVEAS